MSANVGGVGIGTKGGAAGQHHERRGLCLAVLGAALALLLGSGPASAKTIDTIPAAGLVIDQQGHYNVTQDLAYGGSGTAILITASKVVLDLKGHRLSGPGGETIGIHVQTAQEVTVRNGTVTGFFFGIWLQSSNNNTIENNTSIGNGDVGIYLFDSSSNVIQNNTTTGNRGVGISLDSASNSNSVLNNTASSNDVGIRLEGCTSNTVANNAANNGFAGILLHPSSNSNTIQNNTANGNRGLGIQLYDASGNLVQNNTASSNGVYGIWLPFGSGNTSNNTIRNNIANSNGDAGIAVGGSSGNGNTIQNNTALNPVGGPSYYDLRDGNLPTACVNTWTGNTFVKDNESGADYGPGAGCIQ